MDCIVYGVAESDTTEEISLSLLSPLGYAWKDQHSHWLQLPFLILLFLCCFLCLEGSSYLALCTDILGFPGSTSGKELACHGRLKRPEFNPWVGKIPRRKKWQPTLLFLPGKSYGQRSLVPFCPWHCKGSDPTEVT